MTDSEQSKALVHEPSPVQPEDGETYQQAYERMLREGRSGEVLGVLTGQVPVRFMPVARGRRGPDIDGAWIDEAADFEDGASE